MEESFANRVDKVFGSLQVTSSWRLSPHYSQQQQRLHKQNPVDDEDEQEDDEETPHWAAKNPAQHCSFDGMEVQGNLEEEGRIMRQMVGLDNTLDYEDEEDEFDKAAFGLDGSEEDRLYMKGIQENDRTQSTSRSLPSSLYDLKKLSRDPRANHSAARARLEEDAKTASATCTTTTSMETTHATKVLDEDVNKNESGVKRSSEDIPVSEEDTPASNVSLKPPKRVRFALDPQEPRDAKPNTHNAFIRHRPDSVRASQVPDHVRNPSKYTHYTLDYSVEDNDILNFEAFKAFGGTSGNAEEVPPVSQEEKMDKIQFVPKHSRTAGNPPKSNNKEEASRSAIAISGTTCVEHVEIESGNGDMQSGNGMASDEAMDFKTENVASGLDEKPPGKAAKKYRTRRDSEDKMET